MNQVSENNTLMNLVNFYDVNKTYDNDNELDQYYDIFEKSLNKLCQYSWTYEKLYFSENQISIFYAFNSTNESG